jgi:4Fe-4S ferredoxin
VLQSRHGVAATPLHGVGDGRRGLTLVGRMKAWAHDGRQAFATRADHCHGCGLCVTACPEHAITLRRAAG